MLLSFWSQGADLGGVGWEGLLTRGSAGLEPAGNEKYVLHLFYKRFCPELNFFIHFATFSDCLLQLVSHYRVQVRNCLRFLTDQNWTTGTF